jgi:hypothetical protein
MSWKATLPRVRLHYIKLKNVLAMVIFEKQKAFTTTMKAHSQMEDQNNHHHEEEHALQKMFVQVEQEDCENKKGLLKKINMQKKVVAYFQSLIEGCYFKEIS